MPSWALWLLTGIVASFLVIGAADRFMVGVRLAELEAGQIRFRRSLVGRCSSHGFHRPDFETWLGDVARQNPGLMWPAPPTPEMPPVCDVPEQ